jgi:hypothetical protein
MRMQTLYDGSLTVYAVQATGSQTARIMEDGGGETDEPRPIGGPGSASYNLSRPASYSFLLFGEDALTEGSHAYTESMPPSAAPSVRNSGELFLAFLDYIPKHICHSS